MSGKKISIREAEERDLSSIQELNKMLFDYEDQFDKTYNLDWPYSDGGERFFKACIKEDNGIALVAESGGKIIGYACAWIDNYSARTTNPICEIENMFVLEEFRNKGTGTRLVRKIENIAKGKGARRLKVLGKIKNEKALKFYKRLDFEHAKFFMERGV